MNYKYLGTASSYEFKPLIYLELILLTINVTVNFIIVTYALFRVKLLPLMRVLGTGTLLTIYPLTLSI